jgi:DNA repair protein RecO (recombination protein O)
MATSEAEAGESGVRRRRAAPALPTSLNAYVLHRWDWSETSLVVELFTRERGRVAVVAKGAKRPTSNFRAVLLPFHPLQAQLSRSPADDAADVHGLRGAEWLGGVPPLPGAALFSAFYANELLMKLLARDDPHPALFDAYTATLLALATGGDESAALRAFELVLLRETGVLPDLALDALRGEPLLPDHAYGLQAQTGLVASAAAGALPGATWRALAEALDAAEGAAAGVQLQQACAAAGPALRAPLRELLHYHLGAVPLRTRQVWLGLQKLQRPERL